MDSIARSRAGFALALLLAYAPGAPAAGDPSDPTQPAAADRHRPTFTEYRRYEEPARPAWRDLMQEVAPAAADDGDHAAHRHPAPVKPPPGPDSAPEPVDHSHHR